MLQKELLLVFTINFITSSYGARILAYVPTPSYSHQIVFQPLWRELSLRGHQVVLLTTDPIKDESLTNLTEIDLSFSYRHFSKSVQTIVESNQNTFEVMQNFMEVYQIIADEQLGHPSVQALIKNEEERFDVVMVEFSMPAFNAFAHTFKCPSITVASVDAHNHILQIFGNPVNTAIYPDLMLPFEKDLTFLERLINTVVYFLGQLTMHHYIIPDQNKLILKHFGPDYPTASVLMTNASIALVNGDAIFHPIKALVPAIIQIGGGIHTNGATKPLPKELKKELDDAAQGFIYFSLGSNVKSKDIANITRDIIMETFSELRYKILWKFEVDELPNKPSNVVTFKWLPQQEVLKHPNIKLFITQGGLQSTYEAIYNHVPIVGMPYFADQPINVRKMVSKGLGLSVDHNTLNKEDFKSKILEVINNPKYRNKMKELSDLAQDQPMTGMERAVWWTEYVIRHKGARHLRSPALDIPFYQYFLLDVIGVLSLVCVASIYCLVQLGRLLLKLIKFIFCRSGRKIKKH